MTTETKPADQRQQLINVVEHAAAAAQFSGPIAEIAEDRINLYYFFFFPAAAAAVLIGSP